MEDLLIQTLDSFGYPVLRQGSLPKETSYPDHFFTFWNNASDGDAFFDNEEHRIVWDYDLNFYSIDPQRTYSVLLEAKSRLKSVGFLVTGRGHDVMSDEPTHTGRGINLFYLEELKKHGRNF